MIASNLMKTFAMVSLGFAVLAGVVMGQGPKPKTPAPPRTIQCAVMPTMKVDIARANKNKLFADHKGRRYYFCCPGCTGEFRSNPAKYEKMPSLPVPKGK